MAQYYVVLHYIKKSIEDVYKDAKVYWNLLDTLLISITVNMLAEHTRNKVGESGKPREEPFTMNFLHPDSPTLRVCATSNFGLFYFTVTHTFLKL